MRRPVLVLDQSVLPTTTAVQLKGGELIGITMFCNEKDEN